MRTENNHNVVVGMAGDRNAVHLVLDRRLAARAWSKELKYPARSCLACAERPPTELSDELMVDESDERDDEGVNCLSLPDA